MNLANRIVRFEKLAAGIPEVNHDHINALVRFLETGDMDTLPPEGIARHETLMVARMIPAEDADAYAGLARIAEALSDRRLWWPRPGGGWQGFGEGSRPPPRFWRSSRSRALPKNSWAASYSAPCRTIPRPTPEHRLLARLGIIRIYRVHYSGKRSTPKEEYEIEQKRTDS